ncbi:Na+/H+ antiporter subunit A [Sporosarcina pasteurii]|uniref:Multiple resistance and pH homeostasis protein A n=1 Tax=Sporosarcina pasteurii TaxID=1474 RepID=A0A380CH01_SPOPA|nr:Na+/H+ antiporter subunit A [Sporosarcina pasteurii]MDS9472138.1 Na+/H+ antiporter subunit A [Sporosarcina pasteurii]SUJ20395.1 Multiple resistance and pH homeostasis protein A [Sporosarcina pasteurii]
MLTITMAIFIPFLAAILVPFIYKWKPRMIGWFVLIVPLVLFAGLARFIPTVASGMTMVNAIQWIPSANIHFTTYLDGLSIIFGLLITGVGSLVILYSIYYLSSRESLSHFYVYLLMFMGAMLGVVFSDNMMVLYVFWELTSISSFLLIAFWYHRKQSRYGAQKSMLITVSGGVAMLAGFIMLYAMTGSFSIRENIAMMGEITGHSLFIPAMVLVLLGAFTKSAQFPFHIWLPDAMEAPTPVSAYLHSATMVKAGIYLVARFTGVFGGDAVWFYTVSIVGIFTLFWGSFNAVRQTDLKALLAYSTISQLGLVMSLFGLGSAALNSGYSENSVLYAQATFAALFHLVNHSTFKGALFMVVGIVDLNAGTRDVRRLGGLMSLMPVTFTIAIIGSFSMAGLPPFNGFLSKEMFFEAMVAVRHLEFFSIGSWGTLFPVLAWLGSVFTFIYSMIIVFQTFFGEHQPDRLDREAHEAPVGMLIAPSILGLLVVAIFFFPNVIGDYLLRPAMAAVYPSLPQIGQAMDPIKIWHGPNMALWMTVGVIIIGFLLYISLNYWRSLYKIGPLRWNLDSVYNGALTMVERGSTLLTNTYMTGYLRHYFVYIFGFFLLTVAGTIFFVGGFTFDFSNDAPITVNEYILVFVMMVAGILMIFVSSRVTAILLNGVLGYSIALFFVVFRAPDLALTQIVVETVTTALFLLCFYFLPKMKKEKVVRASKVTNGIIAISAGTLVTVIALAVQGNKMFDSISSYFENAYELTGGKNIVNTILGDFRAFDTMLEVVVLFIAGIGVYTLIKLKARKGGRDVED